VKKIRLSGLDPESYFFKNMERKKIPAAAGIVFD
jgi:hypothetical protein